MESDSLRNLRAREILLAHERAEQRPPEMMNPVTRKEMEGLSRQALDKLVRALRARWLAEIGNLSDMSYSQRPPYTGFASSEKLPGSTIGLVSFC